MAMDLHGILNQNEYYTNHYFNTIFEENASETISNWRSSAKEAGEQTPWARFRESSKLFYKNRDIYLRLRDEEGSKELIEELAYEYISALGYGNSKPELINIADEFDVPVFHEETKKNGSPLLWVLLSVAEERDDDILKGLIYGKTSLDSEEYDVQLSENNDDILAKLLFAGAEAPRWIMIIGINQIALIDRNKWDKKKYIQFDLEEIFSRHEETTFQALAVLLHKESLCPEEGASLLDTLDENSYKHSSSVSDSLKFALRECIELLGNEVIYDMVHRQKINMEENPIDAGELTLECLRYMYRILFMLFIEAREELGFAPMKSDVYQKGYSLEGVRDVCENVRDLSSDAEDGYYIDETISALFEMIYTGYPEDPDEYRKALNLESPRHMFTLEPLKAHIFDPQYTKMINDAKLRNKVMLQIVDLMSISRPSNSRERRGRISYSALGINQMGAVYEALLSYRGFIAEEDLYEVKRKGDKFNELEVGYFVPERELSNYDEDERVRYQSGEKKDKLRMYEKGTFIYRLAGREREKSASYYTPEVLTKCLVKYALKELLKDKTADEILHLTVCEPAMGSAAFLNEAINQLAEAYLEKKQEELGERIPFDKRASELQKVKMFIADRNVYGVDLNPTAVELAEVSLWLNTIYKGAHVPWFGTQLVCGNSLIGARRQVYSSSKLKKGTWYSEEPERVTSELVLKDGIQRKEYKRKKAGSSYIYHFLLGDPGMANYNDKVIKELEPENIKLIKKWQNDFCSKYSDDEINVLNNLSDMVDELWTRSTDTRITVEKKTEDSLSVYGHDEGEYKEHLTIREKDKIYKELYKSEGGDNASPYARLKAAMDYWCALWFWPIEYASELPTRQEFFMDLSLILVGGIEAVSKKKDDGLGQFTMEFDETNTAIGFSVAGSELAKEINKHIEGLGKVNLDQIKSFNHRLQISDKIAKQHHFMHWELEFADLFYQSGGFDLVIGNPPWLKMTWNEHAMLSDKNPMFAVKKLNAAQTASIRNNELKNEALRASYMSEYTSMSGTQNYLNAVENYKLLKGQQTNLYKCFIPLAWMIGQKCGISAFVHPDSIFDDPNGELLRKPVYQKLRRHYQFINQLKLFAEVHHETTFSLNVYGNEETDSLELISNLFTTSTIEESYASAEESIVPGIKDEEGNWEIRGHKDRVIRIGKEELLVFSTLFDGNDQWETARLPVIHTVEFLDVLKCFVQQEKTIGNMEKDVASSEMWHEANDQKNGVIVRNVHFPENLADAIFSGPHIGVANPLFKSSRRECVLNSDYDRIDLTVVPDDYIQRINYSVATSRTEYNSKITTTPWGNMFNAQYMVCSRKMLNINGERTLVTSILPPNTAFINGIFGMCFKEKSSIIAGSMASLCYDFYLRITGKSNGRFDTFAAFPVFDKWKHANSIALRSLRLNCLTKNYSALWEKEYEESFSNDCWAKADDRLELNPIQVVRKEWSYESALRSDYERREALVELDVLVAMALGMTLQQLKTIYRIQFPVLQSYEADTWYDRNGRIVFTVNRGMVGVGFSRKEWEEISGAKEGVFTQIITDDTIPGGLVERTIEYFAPFDRCDREKDYEEVWANFEKRFNG